jgi:hypothetical protein
MENPLSPRLEYILLNKVPSLVEHLSMEFTHRQALEVFASADPSHNKSATQWLINTYMAGGFRLEDILHEDNKVLETLVQFGLYRGKLPVSARSLNQYKTLADIYASIETFIPRENEDLTLSGKALKRSERERAHAETEFIHRNLETGFTVVTPMTEFASCWWGRGTRWCTASEKNNLFKDYHKDNPLIIFIMPNGEKYQISPDPDDLQFMDARDDVVSKKDVKDNWEFFKPVFMWLLDIANIATYIPTSEFTDDLCDRLIARYPSSIGEIPLAFITKERIIKSLSSGENLLDAIPITFKTKEICKFAVKRNFHNLFGVPDRMKTLELCMMAFQQDPYAIKYFPENHLSTELALIAVSKNGYSLSSVPYEKQTVEMCRIAIDNNPGGVGFAKPDFLDRDMCIKAVIHRASVIDYVPISILDKTNIADMTMIARSNPEIIRYLGKSQDLKDPDLYMMAIKSNGNLLRNFPEKRKTKKICLEAVKQNGIWLNGVPEKFRDYNMCLTAVKKTGLAIKSVPEELRTIEMCREAIKQNYDAVIQWMPEELKKLFESERIVEPVAPIEIKWKIEILDELRDLYNAHSPSFSVPR